MCDVDDDYEVEVEEDEEVENGEDEEEINENENEDEDDEDEGDDGGEESHGHCPPRRITVSESEKEMSSTSSRSNDAASLSDSILKGHNIGTNTEEMILQKKIASWVRSTGFKCQKYIVRGNYGPRSPLIYHCMKANLVTFDETKWEVERQKYFDKYGKYIKRTLNHKRNCCQSSIKSTLKGKKLR
jgi:hypothetical protein